jgi:hypothetical protein
LDLIDGSLGDGVEELLSMQRGERAQQHPFHLTEHSLPSASCPCLYKV